MTNFEVNLKRIVLGAKAARSVERAALYIQSQLKKRYDCHLEIVRNIPPKGGDIVLGIIGDGTSSAPIFPRSTEEIVLWYDGGKNSPVFALGGSESVIMAVAGKLSRAVQFLSGKMYLPSLSIYEHPAFQVRGHTFANHKQNNTYDKWDWEHWEEYLTEMAAWGNNIAILYPLHPTRWEGSLPFDNPPWFSDPEHEKEFYRQFEIQLKIPQLCHELGMRYGIWIPVNDVFPEEVTRQPEITKYGGTFVCPSIPEARRHINAIREKLFSILPAIDVLFLPSHDDGGCPGCEKCNPWAPVYLDLVKEQYNIVKKYHPNCKVWLSQQGLTSSETRYLAEWLNHEKPEWIEAVAYGPFSEVMTFEDPLSKSEDALSSLEHYEYDGSISGPVNRLRALLPGQYQLILYPDEAHVSDCQYPVMGIDPIVEYVWGREDGPAPRPREMKNLHKYTCGPSNGSIPYSEGNTDDLNKFVWSVLSWNPHQSAEEITYEYVKWFFGSSVAQEAKEMILTIEKVLNNPIYANPMVGKAKELLETCEKQEPSLLENWRWLNLRIGVLMLNYIQQVSTRDRQLRWVLHYRVSAWKSLPDPRSGLHQTINYVEKQFLQTNSLLRDIIWTRDKLFSIQKLNIRGVTKLQNSYAKIDVLLEKWKDVLNLLETGKLRTFPEKHKAIADLVENIESVNKEVYQGISLVEPIQEFSWEKGAAKWRWS